MFKKSDLKTGMFGKMSNGWLFVVVNDTLVYDSGEWDWISSLTRDLIMSCSRNSIDILVKASSFKNAKVNIEGNDEVIWTRSHPKKIPTMREVFFERNPHAPADTDGTPQICPNSVDKNWSDDCDMNTNGCLSCWNRPVPNAKEVV